MKSRVSYNMVNWQRKLFQAGQLLFVGWGDRIRAGAPYQAIQDPVATLLQLLLGHSSPSNCSCPREPVSRPLSLLRWQVVASVQAGRAGPLVAWLVGWHPQLALAWGCPLGVMPERACLGVCPADHDGRTQCKFVTQRNCGQGKGGQGLQR